ncbi:hypothetical protein LSTR_LSTR009692, partial [Laodelphax striatellus]
IGKNLYPAITMVLILHQTVSLPSHLSTANITRYKRSLPTYEIGGPVCLSDDECESHQWCLERWCTNACAKVDCDTWNSDGYCAVEENRPVCKFRSTDSTSLLIPRRRGV